jgi:ABC-type transport system involved in Fe-S cluster assembly fused permease/ATPase subunit
MQTGKAARKAHAVDFIEKFPDTWDQMVANSLKSW